MDFVDAQGRVIVIEADDQRASASHAGKEIGFVETTGLQEVDAYTPWEPPKMTGLNVDAAFQRMGIATQMVKALFEQVGIIEPGDKNIGIGDENALTDEGEALTRRCQELGYIAPFPAD